MTSHERVFQALLAAWLRETHGRWEEGWTGGSASEFQARIDAEHEEWKRRWREAGDHEEQT